MNKIQTLLTTTVLLFGISGSGVADFNDGLNAYKKERQMSELDKWLKLINKKERSAAVLIPECKKAQRDYYFYNKKIKRNVFTGLTSIVLLNNGQSVFNPNKHEVYTLQRDNAESFLEINNCSAYGVYK